MLGYTASRQFGLRGRQTTLLFIPLSFGSLQSSPSPERFSDIKFYAGFVTSEDACSRKAYVRVKFKGPNSWVSARTLRRPRRQFVGAAADFCRSARRRR